MPLIWLSALCAVIMVVLPVPGERTLPLPGGDRDLAARLYKTVFMVLATGIVAGVIPAGSRELARFLRARGADLAGQDGIFAARGRVVTRHDIPGLPDAVAPWLAAALGLAGLVLAAVIWKTE